MIIRFFAFFLIGIYSTIYGVDYIQDQDKQRCQIFKETYDEKQAQPFTQNIARKLTDSRQVDYNHMATLDERQKIYKAMMGSVIVHGKSSNNFYIKDWYGADERYKSHFEAVGLIDRYAQQLWEKAKKDLYIKSLNEICQDASHKTILTEHFITWFYEALEAYKSGFREDGLGTRKSPQKSSVLSKLLSSSWSRTQPVETSKEAVLRQNSFQDEWEETQEAVDIEFADGKKATLNEDGFSFKGPVRITGNLLMSPQQIQYGSVHINRTLPYKDIVKQLQQSSGIKSAVLKKVPLSLDAQFKREIEAYNKSKSGELSYLQNVEVARKFYNLTKEYDEQGSHVACENIPVIQSILGIALANLALNANRIDTLELLKESASLLEKGVDADVETAIKNAPTVFFFLGVHLVNSVVNENNLTKRIPVLREAVIYLKKSKKMGEPDAEKQLAVARFLLAQDLYASVLPYSAFVNRLLGTKEISLLNEALKLATSSLKYCPNAEEFLKVVRSILN